MTEERTDTMNDIAPSDTRVDRRRIENAVREILVAIGAWLSEEDA